MKLQLNLRPERGCPHPQQCASICGWEIFGMPSAICDLLRVGTRALRFVSA